MMSGIRGKDTRPELTVRRFLHAAGLRYRLHVRSLPGIPDLVFPRYRAVVFVHGCFWHAHKDCPYFRLPATRPEFWQQKLAQNAERDCRVLAELQSQGWRVATVWECALRKGTDLGRLEEWLRITNSPTFILDRNGEQPTPARQ